MGLFGTESVGLRQFLRKKGRGKETAGAARELSCGRLVELRQTVHWTKVRAASFAGFQWLLAEGGRLKGDDS